MKSNIRKFRSSEEILHTFTQEEQADLGHQLADKLGILNANKELAKDSAREFRGIIKDNEGDCEMIKRKITEGQERKYVDTEIAFNSPKNGYKTCVRLDNRDELWSREMTADELQMKLFPDEGEYVISGGEGTDEKPYQFMSAEDYEAQQKAKTNEVMDVPFEDDGEESEEESELPFEDEKTEE